MAWAWTSFVSSTSNSITLVVILENHRKISDYGAIYITLDGQRSPNLNYPHYSGRAWWSAEYTFTGLSPSSTYRAEMTIGGSPGDGGWYNTTAPERPPIPNMSQWSASGRNITMQVWNTGSATSLNFYTSWGGWSYGYSPNSTYYSFTAPQYGGHYEIWVEGSNSGGVSSSPKKAYAYAQPNAPVISWDGTFSGNVVPIDVSIQSYFDEIWVEMYTSTGTLYETKKLFWDGNYNRTGRVTFGALTQGATYTFKAKAIDFSGYNGNYSNNLNITYTTPPTTPLARQHSASGRNVTIIVDNYYQATSLKYLPSWTGVWEQDYSLNSTRSWTVPSFGTDYTVTVRGNNSAGDSGDKIVSVTSEPAVPTITGTISNNKATITAKASSGGFSTILVQMLDQYAVGVIEEKTFTYNNQEITFNSTLAVNATYLFRAKAFKTAVNFTPESAWGGYLTLKNDMARPTDWVWTTAQNANGHKISGATFSMLASEWNSFTARINAFRKYKGLDEATFTTASRGGTFYFYMFNEANNAISAMRSTGVSNVSSKNLVYASYFNSLMNALNGIT